MPVQKVKEMILLQNDIAKEEKLQMELFEWT
jgi:hypothetical protein